MAGAHPQTAQGVLGADVGRHLPRADDLCRVPVCAGKLGGDGVYGGGGGHGRQQAR